MSISKEVASEKDTVVASPAEYLAVTPEPEYAARRLRRQSMETTLWFAVAAGDFVMIMLGFAAAFFLRFHSTLVPAYFHSTQPVYLSTYWTQLLVGSLLIMLGLQSKNLYSYKKLLFPFRTVSKFSLVLCACMFTFMGVGLFIQTNPPISRTFVLLATLSIILNVSCWRLVLSRLLRLDVFAEILRRRVVVIGGGPDRLRLHHGIEHSSDLKFVGWVQVNNRAEGLPDHRLGSLHELGGILRKHAADMVVVLDAKPLSQDAVSSIAKICENQHIQFKIVPQYFDILISSLRPDVIGGVAVLGVDSLPLDAFENRFLKRSVDIVGALVGLALSVPFFVIFGAKVYLESPGPILYKQIRQGRNGQLFYIYKIRSMKMGAEVAGKPQWAQPGDPRRLRVGAFMRKYNIDELPQFWNVLRGDMSLVGPRPERPGLIYRFKNKVPHYNARHSCLPGMTGWAQVNGWRGDTSLDERIRHDIWYVENWNIWLDFRILVLTFFRRDNAY